MQFSHLWRNIVVPSATRLFVPGQTTPIVQRKHVVHAHSWHLRNGELIWVEDGVAHNILHDEGEQLMLSRMFDYDNASWAAVPTFYLGLDARTVLAEADTLASLTSEPTGLGGYARSPVYAQGATTPQFALTQPGVYYQASTGTISFTASATWGTMKHRFLCTHVTATTSAAGQRLIATVALSADRVVQSGDEVQTNLIIGLSE